MSKITISNLDNLTIETNDTGKTVLSIIQENFVDWMHACGAKGRCTTCKMIVWEGMNNLSEPNQAELRFSKLGKLNLQLERLACQSIIKTGDVTIEVPESSKLPHMKYSD